MLYPEVFSVQEDGSSSKLTVWVADLKTGIARPLFQSPDIYLNAVFDKYDVVFPVRSKYRGKIFCFHCFL